MKVKIRISVDQLSCLIDFVKQFLQFNGPGSRIQEINLESFLHFGMKKIISASQSREVRNKIKTISFDVNIITAVDAALFSSEQTLNPYCLALYIDIHEQCRSQSVFI